MVISLPFSYPISLSLQHSNSTTFNTYLHKKKRPMAPSAILHLNDLNKFVEVRSGLYRCTTVWNIGGGYVAQVPVSAFLVRHDTNLHDWALIYTCGPNESSILVNANDQFLIHAQDRIRYICITHAHYDHTGGIHALLDKYPESKVVVHVEGKPFLCDGRQFKTCSGDT